VKRDRIVCVENIWEEAMYGLSLADCSLRDREPAIENESAVRCGAGWKMYGTRRRFVAVAVARDCAECHPVRRDPVDLAKTQFEGDLRWPEDEA